MVSCFKLSSLLIYKFSMIPTDKDNLVMLVIYKVIISKLPKLLLYSPMWMLRKSMSKRWWIYLHTIQEKVLQHFFFLKLQRAQLSILEDFQLDHVTCNPCKISHRIPFHRPPHRKVEGLSANVPLWVLNFISRPKLAINTNHTKLLLRHSHSNFEFLPHYFRVIINNNNNNNIMLALHFV